MNPLVYFYQLWRMRYWVVIICVVMMALAWYVTSLLSETYKAEALIFVKRNKPFTSISKDELTPPVFEALLKNDSLLREVMDTYTARYPDDSQPFKKFKTRFHVSSEVLTETAVRKDYSPLVTITSFAGSAEKAAYLVSTWQSLAIGRYGDLIAREQEQSYKYLSNQIQSIDEQLNAKQATFSADKWALTVKVQELTNWQNILAPGGGATLPSDPDVKILSEFAHDAYSIMDFNIDDKTESVEREGLRDKLVQMDIQIAELKDSAEALRILLKDEQPSILLKGADIERIQTILGEALTPDQMKKVTEAAISTEQINPQYQYVKKSLAETEKKLQGSKAARQRTLEKISEVEQNIKTLLTEIGELEPSVQKGRREIERLLKQKALIEEHFNIASLDFQQSQMQVGDDKGTAGRANLFSIVDANAPYRVGPKRLTITGLTGIFMGMFVCFLVVLNVFVGQLEEQVGHARGKKSMIENRSTLVQAREKKSVESTKPSPSSAPNDSTKNRSQSASPRNSRSRGNRNPRDRRGGRNSNKDRPNEGPQKPDKPSA